MACGQTPETQVKIGRNFAEITGWGVRICLDGGLGQPVLPGEHHGQSAHCGGLSL